MPSVSAEVEKVATPPVRFTMASIVAPSWKLTLPLGAPPAELTVAVKVTDWFCPEGFGDEESRIEALALPPPITVTLLLPALAT